MAPRVAGWLTVRVFILALTLSLGASSALAQPQAPWKPQWGQDRERGQEGRQSRRVQSGGRATAQHASVEAFGKAFPDIIFEYVGGRAAEQAMRLQAERDGGVYSVDLFIGGSVTMMELGAYGALERIESAFILSK